MNSILGQTFMNFELILIDDGSPDGCGQLCDLYAILDSRVQVIHQENRGSAGARNAGLKKARGKYLICVDSDDWVEPDYLECLYNEAERSGADVVGCNLVREFGKKTVERKNQLPAQPSDCIRGILEGKVQGWLPVKFLRRSLLVEHEISFVEDLDLWEDMLFSVKIFAFAKTVSNVTKVLYHYRDNPSSIVNSIDERRIREMLGITYQIEDFLSRQGLIDEFGCLIPVLQAQVKLFTVFSPDKQVRKVFRNEMKWTDSLLYKQPVSMAGKICIFCYLHKIFWGQTLLITTRQLLKKSIAFITRKK